MRLAAIYINKHDFLFEEPQTINFGGKYIYEFNPIKESDEIIYIVKRKNNPQFVDKFWGDNISLVSAIVGKNGVGKTILLDILKNNYSKILILIYEDYKTDEIYFDDKLDSYSARIVDESSEFELENNKENKTKYKHLEFDEKNEGTIDISSIREKMFEFNLYENPQSRLYLYNPLEIESKIDSKNEIKNIQFEKSLNFLSDNNVTKNLNEKFTENINFYKEMVVKSIDFGKYLVNADKDIYKRIKSSNESITNFILNSLSYKNVNNELDKIKILIISKVILFKFESFYRDKDYRDKYFKFNKWLYDNNIDSGVYDSNTFKVIINDILRYETINSYEDIYNEFEKFYNFFVKSLTYNITKEKINDLNSMFVSYNKFNLLIDEKITIDFYRSFIKFESLKPISQGEKYLIQLFSNLYSIKKEKYILLFFDEADLGFHPSWKKKFVNAIVKAIPIIFESSEDQPIQIIFTTHDPLTLSDIPNNNVVYLEKDKVNGKTNVLDNQTANKKTFGANVTDLLADSFFIEDGLMGDFAKGKITEIIDWLKDLNRDSQKKDKIKKTIEIIDEPIIKNKLVDMYYELFSDAYDLEEERERVRKRAVELGLIKS